MSKKRMASFPNLAQLLSQALGTTVTEREIAELCGVSQPAVSYWLSGQRRPQPAHCAILSIRLNIEPYVLAEACGYDPQAVFRPLLLLLGPPQGLLDYAQRHVQDIHNVRIEGNPHRAAEMAKSLTYLLQANMQRASDATLEALANIQSGVLFELGMSLEEFLLTEEVVDKTTPLIQEVRNIAHEYDDAEVLGLGEFLQGNAYYIANQHRRAIPFFERALVLMKQNEDSLLLALRTIAVASSCTGNKEQFENVDRTVRAHIADGQFAKIATVCSVIEGLGRAQGKLGLYDEALKTLEEGEGYYAQMVANQELVPAREIQLMRSKFEIVCNLPPRERTSMIDVGEKGRSLAERYGYDRLIYCFDDLLASV
jgi:transcriptional regulator with XRE-family HTH domain